MLGICTPRTPPLPTARFPLHPTPMTLPAGGGPTGRRLHVVSSGLARPGPVDPGPATRRSPTSSPPGSGSRRGPRFPLSGRGDIVCMEPFHMCCFSFPYQNQNQNCFIRQVVFTYSTRNLLWLLVHTDNTRVTITRIKKYSAKTSRA